MANAHPTMSNVQRCFAVTKKALSRFQFITTRFDPASLGAGEILLDVDKFAFTANNMTYAHAGGPPLNYWHFYDNLCGGGENAFGIIPVWGFGTVTHSRNEHVAEGTRHYGYYPMASCVKFNPSKASPPSFTVTREDPALAAVYNSYLNTATDPFYAGSACENSMMVYRPLFLTSFFLDDYCASKFKSVGQVILTSASSKTAFALAHQLKQRGVTVIGLTSARNLGFCESLRLYDSVCDYENISDIQSNETKTVVVDMAGSHDVNLSIDKHFATNIVENVGVGMTHNTVLFGDKSALSEHAQVSQDPLTPFLAPRFGRRSHRLSQATRTFFFAPAWIEKRIAEDATIMESAAASYIKFTDTSDEKNWLVFNTAMPVEGVYAASESNSVNPNTGLITRVV